MMARFSSIIKISPRGVLNLTVLLALLITIATVFFALRLPNIEPQVRRFEDRQIQILADNSRWVDVQSFNWDGESIIASKELALEEPDQIALYVDYNRMLANNGKLYHAIKNPQTQVSAITVDGDKIKLQSTQRQLSDLPLRFWVQLLFALVALIIGGAVLAFGGLKKTVLAYQVNVLFYFGFTLSSCLYGTRQLLIDTDSFRLLHIINHASAAYGLASLMVLLWVSPSPRHKRPLSVVVYPLVTLAVLVDIFQLVPQQTLYFYVLLMVGFFLGLLLGLWQWWNIIDIPVERAAMRWIVLSFIIPLALFSFVLLIPILVTSQTTISQGWTYGLFLLTNLGLGFGVLRYKIFELERWWFSIWSWFISGTCIILSDILLFTLLPISQGNSLLISVAVTGWLYFPVRQMLTHRINRKYEMSSDYWLPKILPLLLSSQTENSLETAIHQQWSKILDQVFMPLSISLKETPVDAAKIVHSGQVLLVPPLEGMNQSFALNHAARGRRLFTKNDIKTLTSLINLTELAVNIAQAKIHGARLERERLARDIHDDLSAKLLTILHQSTNEQRPVVQDTLVELRNLLNQLDVHEVSLSEAFADWRLEASLRLNTYDIKFNWQADVQSADNIVLTSNEYSNIRRILRECVTNALKYMNNSKINITITRQSANQVQFTIQNYGYYLPVPSGGTRGIKNIVARAESMKGKVSWRKHQDYFMITFSVAFQYLEIKNSSIFTQEQNSLTNISVL